MTPTASRLQVRLDGRRRWFANEWFFKWHFIGKDGPVSIDSFDGSEIHLGGIKFSGSARDLFWDAIVRGVRKEVDEQFAWIDDQVRHYNYEAANKAIDECGLQLITFVRSIRRLAVVKDRILRGNGTEFPPEDDAGNWDFISDTQILSQAQALRVALPVTLMAVKSGAANASLGKREIAARLWHENQWWLGPIAFLVGLAGLYPLIF
ncbi:MAG: hypothetical protein K2W86_17385 [Sphingomonas sp.]|uniref:hypothetical protein n=1 Tax=Sphingomonas sp. TaxID=28214 RepID=UPI0035A970F0|nr:hypothetical protein [Sphingomonas sp.]